MPLRGDGCVPDSANVSPQMLSSVPLEFVLVLGGIALAGVFWRHAADRRHIRELQESASRAFRSTVINAGETRLGFNGVTAVVERREEVGSVRGIFEKTADLGVTIYARNEFGEQFLFKWFSKSSHAPFVKHLQKGSVHPSFGMATQSMKVQSDV
jgi:hypothetical protein